MQKEHGCNTYSQEEPKEPEDIELTISHAQDACGKKCSSRNGEEKGNLILDRIRKAISTARIKAERRIRSRIEGGRHRGIMPEL